MCTYNFILIVSQNNILKHLCLIIDLGVYLRPAKLSEKLQKS